MTRFQQRRSPKIPDEAHLWHTGALGGLDLFSAYYTEFRYPQHTHEQFMIAVTAEGIGLPRFRGGVHPVGPGDVLVLNPGEVHSGGPQAQGFWRYRAFYPPAELMQRIVREFSGGNRGIPQFKQDVVQNPRTASMLHEAHAILERIVSALEAESRLIAVFANLIEQHAAGTFSTGNIGNEHRAVKRAKEYLHALPMENISLERLSHEAGLSPYYFSRVFRRATGLSPHRYQLLRRVNLAKHLLADGLPISQVAVKSGFYDQSHLTRHFKRVFGVTPGEYNSSDFLCAS